MLYSLGDLGNQMLEAKKKWLGPPPEKCYWNKWHFMYSGAFQLNK